ncbi:MAG: hypothetical protein HY811_08395 [Planctomycetes bacterium]|nr:hypothetical protein [Planctomycetota bacterium]
METRKKRWAAVLGLWVVLPFLILNLLWAGDPPAPVPPPKPATSYVISNMETSGTVSGELANFKTTISVSILEDGWRSIELFPSDASLTSFKVRKGNAKEIILNRQQDTYFLMANKKGDYVLEFEHVARLRSEKLGNSVNVFFIPAANASVRMVLPMKDAKVSVSPEVNFGVLPSKGNTTEVMVFNTVYPAVTVSWSTVETERLFVPTHFAEQRTVYTVSKGNIRVESFIDYSILIGEIDRFEIALSEDLNIIDVVGDKIKKWDTRDDPKEGKVLVVETSGGMAKAYSIQLILEKTLEALPISFTPPKIKPLGVSREKGYISVISKKGIRVEPGAMENIAQIDIQDLPSQRVAGIDLAFKYLKRPFNMTLTAYEIPPKVFADILTLSRASKDSIRLDTYIMYTIRESGVFHFKIQLPESLKIIDINGENINNWQIKDNILTIDLRSQAEGQYYLSLITEKATEGSAKAVPFPIIKTLETEREEGYLAVSALSGVKVELASLKNINQINIREFPFTVIKGESDKPQPVPGSRQAPLQVPQQQVQNQSPLPQSFPDLAFRYLKQPYEINLFVKDIKPEVNVEFQTIITIDERKLELTSNVIYDIRKAGVFNLKLSLPRTLHITELKGANVDDWRYDEAAETLSVTLATRVEGNYLLQLKAEQMLTSVEKGMELPRLQALDASKEHGYLALSVDPVLRVKTDSSKLAKLIEIDLKDLPPTMARPNLTLAYKYYESGWTLALLVEKIKSYITVETFHFASVGESLIHTSATLKYDIQFAGVSNFKFQFPPEAKNIDINGENIKHKGKVADDETAWTVELHSPRQGTFYLYVTFQVEMGKTGADGASEYAPLNYTGIKVLDVERETGYLALAARADMELSNPKPENLTPLDEKEIPASYKVGIDYPILMAFRYLKHPYALTANISRHEFSEVLVAIVEGCRLSTTISKDGQLITDLLCKIRNTREQYLRLYLPANTEIWHVRVAGINESSFKAVEKGASVVLIPIAQQSKSDKPFVVNVRYAYKIDAFGASGIINLTCPSMNIPVMRLGWSLSIPDKYEVVMNAGNMEKVDRFEPLIAQLNDEQAPAVQVENVPAANDQKEQQVYQLSSNTSAVENIRYPAGKGGDVASASSMYTGTIPTTTKTYYYQTLISLDIPANIYAHYLKSGFSHMVNGLFVILAVLVTLFLWFKTGGDSWKKMGKVLVAVLVILGISTLIGESYKTIFSIIIWVPVMVTVIIAVALGFKEYFAASFQLKPKAVKSPAMEEYTEPEEVNEEPKEEQQPPEEKPKD